MACRGVATGRVRRDTGDVAAGARSLPSAARPWLPAGETDGAVAVDVRPLVAGEPWLDWLRPNEHCPWLSPNRVGIRLAGLPLPRKPAELCTSAMALALGGGGPLPHRVPGIRARARRKPGPVAPLPGRREAHGLRLPERRPPIHHHAAAGPVVCWRRPELLLLRAVHGGDDHSSNGHSVGCGLQPGCAALLRAHCSRGVLPGLQHDGRRTTVVAPSRAPPTMDRRCRGRGCLDDGRRLGQPARRWAACARRHRQLRLLGAHAHDAAGPARFRDHGVPLLHLPLRGPARPPHGDAPRPVGHRPVPEHRAAFATPHPPMAIRAIVRLACAHRRRHGNHQHVGPPHVRWPWRGQHCRRSVARVSKPEPGAGVSDSGAAAAVRYVGLCLLASVSPEVGERLPRHRRRPGDDAHCASTSQYTDCSSTCF